MHKYMQTNYLRLLVVIPVLVAATPGCHSLSLDEAQHSSPWTSAFEHDTSVSSSRFSSSRLSPSRPPYLVRHQSKPTFAATGVYEWFEMHPVLGYTLITAAIVLPIVLINEGKN